MTGGSRRAAINEQAAVVHFGARALGLARSQPPPAEPGLDEADDDRGAAASAPRAPNSAQAAAPPEGSALAVPAEERQVIVEMQRRDREVRTHEQAHKSAGGAYAGSVRLTYQMGPDGKRYAVEGEVPIDMSPVAGDPAATLRKMEVVARAARAPAQPSSADQAVAAQATRMMQQARAQLAAERYARTRELVPG
jgi:hypothetical protein